jgi:hypothetical protein
MDLALDRKFDFSLLPQFYPFNLNTISAASEPNVNLPLYQPNAAEFASEN